MLPITSNSSFADNNFKKAVMTQPIVLQVGPYPEWDQGPLDAAFDIKRLFDEGLQRAGNSAQIEQ